MAPTAWRHRWNSPSAWRCPRGAAQRRSDTHHVREAVNVVGRVGPDQFGERAVPIRDGDVAGVDRALHGGWEEAPRLAVDETVILLTLSLHHY